MPRRQHRIGVIVYNRHLGASDLGTLKLGTSMAMAMAMAMARAGRGKAADRWAA